MFGLGTLNQARFNIYFPKTSGNGNETQASVTNFEGVKTFIKEIRKWPSLILSNTITMVASKMQGQLMLCKTVA